MPDTIDTSKINIDSTYSMAQAQTPSKEHSIFAFKVGSDGKPEKGTQGWYTIQALLDALGQIATDAESGAVTAQEAAEAAQAVCEEALAAIGNSDTAGLRGQAITAIQTALTNALAAIGESNSEGARGDALSAIAQALNNSLIAIGQNDTQGARGAAVSSIATHLASALDSISQKVTEASASAALAQKYAEESENTPVEGSGDTATFSAKHYAAKAQQSAQEAAAAANSPLASESTAGRTRITSNPDYTKPDGMTDPVALSIEGANTLKSNIMANFTFADSSYTAAVTA